MRGGMSRSNLRESLKRQSTGVIGREMRRVRPGSTRVRAVALTAACRGAANSAGKKGSSLPPTGGETRQARRPLGLGRLFMRRKLARGQ